MPAYLKLGDIKGEVTDEGYEDMVRVLSYNHGVSQQARTDGSAGGGRTVGSCDHSDFSVTKVLDRASPILAEKCSEGAVIPEATFVLVQAGGDNKLPYMEYKLTDVLISSTSVSGGGEEYPVEVVTLNYRKIVWTYTPQLADGTPGGKTTGTWDLNASSKK